MRRLLTAVLFASLIILAGCPKPGGSGSTGTVPGGGVQILTQYQEGGSKPVTIGFVNLKLHYVKNIDNFGVYYPAGSITNDQNIWTTVSDGLWTNYNIRSPAQWNVTWTQLGTHGECAAAFNNGIAFLFVPIASGQTQVTCLHRRATQQEQIQESTGAPNTATITPAQINLNSPPSTLIIHGSGFSAEYGLPAVLFFDSTGNSAGEMDPVNASEVTSTSITVPADLADFKTGTYTFIVGLQDSGSDWYAMASGTVTAKCIGTCQ